MASLLRGIDIFGTRFSYTINYKAYFRTVVGGLLSILSAVLFIVLFVVFGNNLFQQINPKTSVSNYIAKTELMRPKDYNLTIAFQIQKLDGSPPLDLQGGFLWAYLTNKRLEYNNKTNQHEFNTYRAKISKCNNMSYKPAETFSERLYCFDFDDKDSLGGLNSTAESILNLELFFCEKGEPIGEIDSNCRTIDEMKEKFKIDDNEKYYMNLYYPVLYYDSRDKDSPANIVYESITFPFEHNLQRIDDVYFHKNIIQNDYGWLFEDYDSFDLWTVESETHYYNYKTDEDLEIKSSSSRLYRATFYMNLHTKLYTRNYMKVLDVLPIDFAIIQCVLILFRGFTTFLNLALIKFHVFRQMFDCSLNPPTKLSMMKMPYFNMSSQNAFSFSNNINNNLNNNDVSLNISSQIIQKDTPPIKQLNNLQISNKGNKDKQKKNNNGGYTKWFAFKRTIIDWSIWCIKRRHYDTYDKGNKIVTERIELNHYVKILYDVINLKKNAVEQNEIPLSLVKVNLYDQKALDYYFGHVNNKNDNLIFIKGKERIKEDTKQIEVKKKI